MFHYDSNDNVTPEYITLTAHPENVEIVGWRYKDSDGDWVPYPTQAASYNG